MIKRISNQLRGYVKIRITGYSPERFLNLCKHKEIEIWALESCENSYEMYMFVCDFRKIKPILKKTRTRITILERCGVPFFFHKYRKRKLFFVGIFTCLTIIFMLSRLVWNIEISGNQMITDEVLLEYLETQKVYHGMWRNAVDCEAIVTKLRKNFDDIIWVSVSLEGSNVRIHVRENTDTFEVGAIDDDACDLVASADGKILQIITRSGVPCVKEGDIVKKGDLLVSGKIEVKNDAQEVVREDYKMADADVYAEVMIPYQDFCDTVCKEKEYTKTRRKFVYIDVCGYRLGLGIKKTEIKNFETHSNEKQLKINDDFKLPIRIGTWRGIKYNWKSRERGKEEKETILNHNLELYCKELAESGIEILEKQIQYKETAKGLTVNGYLKVKESIVLVRKSVDF